MVQNVGKSKKAAYLAKVKAAVIDHYSGGTTRCAMCDVNDVRMLTIDHIDGGGKQHRRRDKIKSIYRHLQKAGFPTGYRVLCFNHNMGLVCRGPNSNTEVSHRG